MRINDLNKKVVGTFYKEIVVDDDDGDDITYIFPDTKEFISIINRKFMNKQLRSSEELTAEEKT